MEIFAIDEYLVFTSVIKSNHRDGVKDRGQACGFYIKVNAFISKLRIDTPRLTEGGKPLKKCSIFSADSFA